MPDVGGPELIIILVVVLVLFGGSQLPKLARGLGQAQNEFKKGMEGDKDNRKDNRAVQPPSSSLPSSSLPSPSSSTPSPAADHDVVRPDHQA